MCLPTGPSRKILKSWPILTLRWLNEIEVVITGLLEAEMGFDGILKGVCDSFGISLNAGQYALVGSTLRSFLTYLHDEARIEFTFADNRMLWRAAAG